MYLLIFELKKKKTKYRQGRDTQGILEPYGNLTNYDARSQKENTPHSLQKHGSHIAPLRRPSL
jgi:hypothetical protein